MSRRRGFTLVEILVVVVIIGVLIAILLPVLGAAINTANNARTTSEEYNLAVALTSFKTVYGDFPPSRIILWDLVAGKPAPYGADSTPVAAGDITYGDLNQRTIYAMRKFFPRAQLFFPSQGVCSISFKWGKTNPVILTGDEALTFFLGGMPQTLPDGDFALTGFNRDPANPFTLPSLKAAQNSRRAPFYEFPANRLVDLDNDGFPSFIDAISYNGDRSEQRPYAYFSAYGNNGYCPGDCDSNEQDDLGNVVSRSFYVNFAVDKGRICQSPAPNPYCSGDPAPANPQNNAVWHNPQSFQIISAGRDGMWGPGGSYNPSSNDRLPVGFANDPANNAAIRRYEADNVANFAQGKLD
jgi:prepilin-type N-terminal cleavage/methylation domain-containing protein